MGFTDLIILLHTKSVSYCYYKNNIDIESWIPINILEEGIRFALKNNLHIQFVYPEYELSENYKSIVESIKHSDIMPCHIKGKEDTMKVFSSLTEFIHHSVYVKNCILHIKFSQIEETVKSIIAKDDSFNRLDIVIDDIEFVQDSYMQKYTKVLKELSSYVRNEYDKQKEIHINILTDRIFLHNMNNCNAGVNNLTLAPNGYFYICPAFYFNNSNDNVGDIQTGVNIKNKQLYRLEYAPICRICDAYQCKRCIWLNKKTTLEVNTPSHEQCIISHTERNASMLLLNSINQENLMIDNIIKEIDYIDPFDKIK